MRQHIPVEMVERQPGLQNGIHQQNVFPGGIHLGCVHDFVDRRIPRTAFVHFSPEPRTDPRPDGHNGVNGHQEGEAKPAKRKRVKAAAATADTRTPRTRSKKSGTTADDEAETPATEPPAGTGTTD